jgi:hypothetical protein
MGKGPNADCKATRAAVKAEQSKMRKPALGAGKWRLYIWYKLIDGNKQPEKSNVQRITVHKEFPISTESRAKSNVNQLLFFFWIARFFRYTCVPPRPGFIRKTAYEKPSDSDFDKIQTFWIQLLSSIMLLPAFSPDHWSTKKQVFLCL